MPPIGTLQTTSAAARVVSTVVSDALSIARSKELTRTQTLTRIGKYQFDEKSYRQLQIWAEEIIVDGETGVGLDALVELLDENLPETWEFVVNGQIVSVFFHHCVGDGNKG